MAHVITKACTKCGACLFECPTASILEGKDQYVIDTDTCRDHRSCVTVCPVDAIHPAKPATPGKPETPTPSRTR
jgi:NAD-dependent dihydropyrimidine dehydrogenase PreA subunit